MKRILICACFIAGMGLQLQVFAQQAAGAQAQPTRQSIEQKIRGLRGLDASSQASGSQADQQSSKQSQASTTRATAATTGTTNAAAKSPSISAMPNMADEAFAGVVQQQLPMTPKQIAKLHRIFNESQRAAATPPEIPARPSTSALIVDLSPNATPPVIRLGAGYISSLVFMDATGQPWPIKAYSVGDPNAYNIQWDKHGNTLLVQADTFFKRSNLAVMLEGLDTPVMLTLLPGQTAVDYRVDLRMPGLGPNASFSQNGLPSAADPVLLNVLNGVPPKGARTLHVLGDDNCQAWLLNNTLYLRTDLEVISPAWTSIMTSADGTHAYVLQPTSVILALEHGKDKMIKLILEGLS